MTTTKGLDRPCGSCRRRSGDHTLDEWAACIDTPTHDLAYEEAPADVSDLLRARFQGLDGYAIADNVVARAAVLQATSGPVDVAVAALLLEFSIGDPINGPQTTAQVAFLAPADVMRRVGVLLRDAANGAANRAA